MCEQFDRAIQNIRRFFLFYAMMASATGLVMAASTDSLPYRIVDTAQVRCYSHDTEIEYPKNDAIFNGQDAQYAGHAPAYQDNQDGTATDLHTGLMWQKDPGQKKTFVQAMAGASKCRLAGHTDWRLPTIKELYSLILFSGTDPDPQSMDSAKQRPFIDTQYFKFQYGNPNQGERIIDSQFVTSTKYVGTTMRGDETVFGVNFADGRIKGYGMRSPRTGGQKTFYCLYVRGNPRYGKNDFQDNGNGTVTDKATGLMWMKGDSGTFKAGRGQDGKLNWQAALAWAETLEYAGYSDWRLPNVKELQSIVDYTRSPATTNSAAIDPVFQITSFRAEGGQMDFPNYWSSTTHAGLYRASTAAYVAFGRSFGWMPNRRTGQTMLMDVHGAGSQRSDPKAGDPSRFPHGRGPQGDAIRITNFVRCVRGGQAEPRTTGPALDIRQAPRRGMQTQGFDPMSGRGPKAQASGVIINKPGTFKGYTLFAPINSTVTYLIDDEGRVINQWKSEYRPGHSVYLLENGHLLRTGAMGPRGNTTFRAGGSGGHVQEFTWEGKLVWDYTYSSQKYLLHHDIEIMPNGNILMIAWEKKGRRELIAAGRNPESIPTQGLWVDHVIEVKPMGKTNGDIVWKWHVFDHVIQDVDASKKNYGDVARHPELLNLNYIPRRARINEDWNHTNAIDYNPKLDQIMLTLHGMSEIFVIDHSTTPDEAVGHTGGRSGRGGDILYRWGNPQVYGAGRAKDQKLFVPHDGAWIESGLPGAGHIMIFNNGQGRPDGQYSSVDVIVPPVDKEGQYVLGANGVYGPTGANWIYTDKNKPDFFSQNISGAQRLANGNTLICSGAAGTIFEVSPDKEVVWKYIHPDSGRGPGPGGFGPGMGPPPMGGPGMRGPARQRGPQMRPNMRRGMNRRGPGMGGPGGPPPMDGPPGGPGQGTPIFRAYRYAPDYPGCSGKDLTPGKLMGQ